MFGITEREGGPVQVLNAELYDYIKKERFKSLKAKGTEQSLGPVPQPGTQMIYPNGPSSNGGVQTGRQPDVPTIIHGQQEVFSFDDNMEKEEQNLPGPKEKRIPMRTLFMVSNRRRNTLSNIINQYIVPGSIIFSDGWSGYVNLHNLQHVVVIHKNALSNIISWTTTSF